MAFPTETVYGLGADAFNAEAVRRVFSVKGRPADDPLIVHVSGTAQLDQVAVRVPPLARQLATAFWPGPLTVVVPRRRRLPAAVTAGLDSVAVRCPSHPVALALLAAADTPIAAPSANRFGHLSPTTAEHVIADLGASIELVLDGGPSPVGVESTVLDCRVVPPVILRPGGVTLEELKACIGEVRLARPQPAHGPQRSPGQLARHYAPRARLILLSGREADIRAALRPTARALASAGLRVGLLVASEDEPLLGNLPAAVQVAVLARLTEPATAAHRLFGALRALDEAGSQVILARDFGTQGLALAVRDRLIRAAEGAVVVAGDQVAATVAEVLRLSK